MLANGALDRFADASDHLRSHVLARMAQAHRQQQEAKVANILTQAACEGCPSLAREASDLIESNADLRAGKLGQSSEVLVPPVHWEGPEQRGRGTVTVLGRRLGLS